jgi:peroxiredoxin (alkyl hydroperoxide reductase subunit C)
VARRPALRPAARIGVPVSFQVTTAVTPGGSMPVDVGAEAPDFVLKDQNNQEVRLSDFRGDKNVLLVFYPLAFTGTCQGELSQVRDGAADFQNADVQVLAISVDSSYSHKVWADREGYDFPLLADFWPHGEVAHAYGVFNPDRGFANRGTFLIDRTGIVRYAEMNGPGEARDPDTWRKAIGDLA